MIRYMSPVFNDHLPVADVTTIFVPADKTAAGMWPMAFFSRYDHQQLMFTTCHIIRFALQYLRIFF